MREEEGEWTERQALTIIRSRIQEETGQGHRPLRQCTKLTRVDPPVLHQVRNSSSLHRGTCQFFLFSTSEAPKKKCFLVFYYFPRFDVMSFLKIIVFISRLDGIYLFLGFSVLTICSVL
jgi:hypothetical protein